MNELIVKKKYKGILYFNADFETLAFGSKDYIENGNLTDVFRWGYTLLYSKFTPKPIKGKRISEFFEQIIQDGRSKHFYCHNLSFDGDFILKYLLNKTTFKFMNLIDNYEGINKLEKNSFKTFGTGGNIYRIEVYISKWSKELKKKVQVRIIFTCSAKLLNASIETLGKDQGINKYSNENQKTQEWYKSLGYDMNEELTAEVDEYLERDLTIQRNALLSFFTELKKLPWFVNEKTLKPIKISKALTIGYLIMCLYYNYVQSQLLNGDIDNFEWNEIIYSRGRISIEDYRKYKKVYSGGFTQFNPEIMELQEKVNDNKLVLPKLGTMIDIISSYPFQCTKPLPYGSWAPKPFPDSKKYENMEFIEAEVDSAVIKPEFRNLVILKNWKKKYRNEEKGRYVRRLTNFSCAYTKKEWDFINHVYNIKIKKIESYYRKSSRYMKPFIDVLFSLKAEAKKSKNFGREEAIKILINNLSGKYGQREQFTEEIYLTKEQLKFFKNNIKVKYQFGVTSKILNNEEMSNFKIGEKEMKYLHTKEKEVGGYNIIEALENKNISKTRKYYQDVGVAGVITSYARQQLFSSIIKLGIKNFIYSDTDSIISRASLSFIKKKLSISDYDLGSWSIVMKFNEVTIGSAKKYVLVNTIEKIDKIVLSGANKTKMSIEEIKWKLVNGGILVAGLTQMRDKNGTYLIEKSILTKKGTL